MWPSVFAVPHAWMFPGQVHVDWLCLTPVRAEVAAAVLELLQVFDGVSALWGGHGPHAEWKRHLDLNTNIKKMNFTKLFEAENERV